MVWVLLRCREELGDFLWRVLTIAVEGNDAGNLPVQRELKSIPQAGCLAFVAFMPQHGDRQTGQRIPCAITGAIIHHNEQACEWQAALRDVTDGGRLVVGGDQDSVIQDQAMPPLTENTWPEM